MGRWWPQSAHAGGCGFGQVSNGDWFSPWALKKVQHSLAGLSGSVVGDHCMLCTCMVVCVVASVRVRLEHVCIAHGTALDSRLLC